MVMKIKPVFTWSGVFLVYVIILERLIRIFAKIDKTHVDVK